MLMAGQAEELSTLVSAVLDKDSEQLEALRMMVRCMSWLKDEARFRESLNLLAKAARNQDSVDDERFALSQIVMIAPHESEYVDRLKEINELHGFEQEQDQTDNSLFDKRFVDRKSVNETNGAHSAQVRENVADFAIVAETDTSIEGNGFAFAIPANVETEDFQAIDPVVEVSVVDVVNDAIGREVESIRFYIESGYAEIAEKAIGEFRAEYGDRSEIGELMALL
jgi:hypothetical protein